MYCRRYWSYSLRTLFVATTVLACALGWKAFEVRERVGALRDLQEDGGHMFFRLGEPHPWPRWRVALGDRFVDAIVLPFQCESAVERRFKRLFPEASVMRDPDDPNAEPQMTFGIIEDPEPQPTESTESAEPR